MHPVGQVQVGRVGKNLGRKPQPLTCLVVWGALSVRTALLNDRTDAITDWCMDNAAAYTTALTDAKLADGYNALTGYTQDLDSVLASYPDVTNDLLTRIENAGSSSISILFTAYDAASGSLLFDAKSSEVIDIPAYIRSLQNCGVFSTVTYTGYSSANGLYTINLRCVLAAPQ